MASKRSSTHRARWLAAQWRARRGTALPPGHDESGAVIILALVFLVAVSLIVTGLLTFVGTSLHATGSFQNERGWNWRPPMR